MPEFSWKLSEQDTVTVKVSWTGRKKLFLNDNLIEKYSRKKSKDFPLSDQRSAQITSSHGIAHQGIELKVDGELAIMNIKGQDRKCDKCSTVARPFDKFCDSCGSALPTAEAQQANTNVQTASSGIGALAILFVISGLVIAGLQYSQAQDALQNLAQFEDAAQWSEPVNGKIVTVGQLREMVEWEPISTLLINLVLAGIMAGLYVWGKTSPLPATLAAAGTYLAVQVLSAIANPASLGQGIILKVIIVAVLYRGIKAGFQQRSLQQ